jgi:hypothetical protein
MAAKYLLVPAAVEAVTGSRPHPSTCWRWCIKGSAGVVLKTWMVGGRRMTTPEAVQDFIARKTAQTTPTTAAEQSEVSKKLQRELVTR